ncbi:MAG: aminotransferase class V-fold PLP-dependent enzyme [Solirubrobacterales bacterium]
MKGIYLDNAATSWPKPESVYQTADHFNRFMGANPGRGSNARALEASMTVFETREVLAKLFNIGDSDRIAFTFNVTEALNVALKGSLSPGDHLIITGMEHNAVARPAFALQQSGVDLSIAPCSLDGSLDPETIRSLIKPNTRVVCMLHASNVIGTIYPIAEVGQITREAGVRLIVDAAQSAGCVPIDVEAMQIDILCFTGHKALFGLQGTGGLWLRPGIDVRPLKQGGTGSLSESLSQPDFLPDLLEAGTQNGPGLAALGAGVRFILKTGVEQIRAREEQLTALLMNGLKEIKSAKIYGPQDTGRRTAVVSFNLGDLDCGEVSLALDREFGIANRSGLHCAPLAHRTLGTIERGACRLSPGYFTTEPEIKQALKALRVIAGRE